MSSSNQTSPAETNSLPAEMMDLADLIDSLGGPEKRAISVAYDRVAESILRRRRILNLVQEALSQLRLDVKYLMFDLETTRRERDQLQSQLEENDRGF
ncbi:MAG: transcriptional regulator [Planctomycetota bacterium]|nr:transcriptional regulator [Planctomycetota bacterium]